MMRIALAAALLTLGTQAHALDICEAVALHDVAPDGIPDGVIKRGQFDTSVTQYNVDKKTGEATICSHGGYCYPTRVRIDGKMVEVLILTNCRLGKKYEDADGIGYQLEPIWDRIEPKEALEYKVSDKLMNAGLTQAEADNAAAVYAYRPQSKCGRVVSLAIRGNKLAVDKIQDEDAVGCQATSEEIYKSLPK